MVGLGGSDKNRPKQHIWCRLGPQVRLFLFYSCFMYYLTIATIFRGFIYCIVLMKLQPLTKAYQIYQPTHVMEDETLVKAFETYKKKDSSKGTWTSNIHQLLITQNYPSSCCALQRRRECTDHETKHVQDYSHQSIPSCDPILEKRIRVAKWRASSEFHLSMLIQHEWKKKILLFLQFLYINSTFRQLQMILY